MKNEYFDNLDEAAREDLAKRLDAAKDWRGIPAAFWRALLSALIESGTETRLDSLASMELVVRDEETEEMLNPGEFWIFASTYNTRDEDLNIYGIVEETAAKFGLDVLDWCRDGDSLTILIGSMNDGDAAKRYALIDRDDGAVWDCFDNLDEALKRRSDGDFIFDREAGKEV
ncbi:MAG: hypothetical protein J6L64_07890 [Opitutales bacterium]|nr:hypothetical protein [Opitutales bacterium]